MTNPEPGSDDLFRLENFRQLLEMVRANDLNEVDLRKGDWRIRLRRGMEPQVSLPPRLAPPPVLATPVPGPAKAAEAAPADDKKLHIIKSQLIGTYYAAPNPESPPFVKIGDQVGPETTLCMIEAMKTFTELPAECTGRIAAILVNNGDPVEFNQPLFKVELNG